MIAWLFVMMMNWELLTKLTPGGILQFLILDLRWVAVESWLGARALLRRLGSSFVFRSFLRSPSAIGWEDDTSSPSSFTSVRESVRKSTLLLGSVPTSMMMMLDLLGKFKFCNGRFGRF